jgi:mono/diheme cytochrome c family protein
VSKQVRWLLAFVVAPLVVGASSSACGAEGASPKLVADLHLLARGAPIAPSKAETIAAGLATADDVDRFIDAMLKDGAFASRVAPGMLLGAHLTKPDHPISDDFVLQREGEGPLFLRRPCPPSDAIEVVPWWSDAPVAVCPEAVKADVIGDGERQCGALHLRPADSDLCGCGPALIRCFESARHYQQVRSALNAELRATIAAVVKDEQPVAEVFTRNRTVRGQAAEAVYARARIMRGDEAALDALRAFPKKPDDLARPEALTGQHAGILTAPSLVYSSDASRGVLRTLYDLMWCTGHASARVDTQTLLRLDVVDLRVGDGWKQLASMPVCTDCHARLDYGMQFFSGYPSAYNGVDFVPSRSLVGVGPLYASSIDDHRGEGPLTPQGFAQMAVAQDEFGQCMSQRVLDHVFHGAQTAGDAQAVRARFLDDGSLRGMMAAALKRYARAQLDGRPSPQRIVASAPAAARDEVEVPPALARALKTQCVACHADDPALPDLSARVLPRRLLQRSADRVASGLMPPAPDGLDAPRRRAMTGLLVDAGWASAEARSAALEHLLHGRRGEAVHEPYAALGGVAKRAGQRGASGWLLLESFVSPTSNTVTPGWASTVGLEALAACRRGRTDDLDACLREAMDPRAFTLPEP